MKLVKKDYRRKLGTPPGTLFSDEETAGDVFQCQLYDYSRDTYTCRDIDAFSDLSSLRGDDSISWLNIIGIRSSAILEWIGREFDIHPLVLEDIQNTGQRPKLEDYDSYLFISCRMLSWDDGRNGVEAEQVSFLLGTCFLVTFQERPGDVFDIIRTRISEGKGRIRQNGADYLAYALIDAIIDHYYLVVEHLQDLYEDLEERILLGRPRDVVPEIHRMRKEIITLRRAIWPLRDVMNQIGKGEVSLVSESTVLFFRDVEDHVNQIIEADELLREMLSGVLEYHQSTVSNDMNSVMKVLTIIATIFIPLTFIAGVYGMNFYWMPELAWKWGYPVALGFMASVAVCLIVFFRKRRWL